MFIEWTDIYKLGIPEIDSQHRGLVDLLNSFFSAAQEGAVTSELTRILDRLVDLTAAHFQREEKMLDRLSYPGLAAHMAEHQRLLQQLGHFRQPYSKGEADRHAALEAAEFLSRWLLEHIQVEDRPYRPYVMLLS